MTPDEVAAMTNEELRAMAWELQGGCWGEDAPDYPNDITAAMGLFARLCKMRTNCTIYVANGAGCHCWDVMGGPGRDYENGIHGYADWEEGTLRAVCRAITRAFILAREAE
jgi:hypothetical protein